MSEIALRITHQVPLSVLISQEAKKFESDIFAIRGDEKCNAKSVLELLTIIPVKNMIVTIMAEGTDAEDALKAILIKYEQFQALEDSKKCLTGPENRGDGSLRKDEQEDQNINVENSVGNRMIIRAMNNPDKTWHWEGNIQSRVVQYLVENGHVILFEADTAQKQPGKDIEAEKDGISVWVTVKGYPKGTPRTKASTQCRHWFKGAIYDIIKYRQENRQAILYAAFPDFPKYHRMKEDTGWLKQAAGFRFLWVSKDGEITVE